MQMYKICLNSNGNRLTWYKNTFKGTELHILVALEYYFCNQTRKTQLKMKLKLTIAILMIWANLSSIAQSTEVRIQQLFNFDWKFQLGDIQNAHAINFDDSQWQQLDIPHDFQFDQAWDESVGGARGFKAMGIGWYRKSFKADPDWKGREVILDFEGIMLHGDAYLNGKLIGGTDYGYLGFEANISHIINYEGENTIAVRASTGEVGSSRWYTGGGLFRDVHLIVKNKISVARNGLYIFTPRISDGQADIQLQVEIEGIKRKKESIDIQAKIFSPTGKLILETFTTSPIDSKKELNEVKLPLLTVDKPELWSCENPNLYTAEITLMANGKTLDQTSDKFGIRTVEFSKDFGFKLNGEKVFLKGISNHHDLGAVGAAAHETAIARQMDILKAFGFNHIRTSHNPYSKSFLRIADEKGILIVDELFDKWNNGNFWPARVPFTELWYKAVPEWIKRDRNHPSVILWSFGNELQISEDWAGFKTSDWGITTYNILNVLAKRYDNTRKTTVAMFPAREGSLTKDQAAFHTHLVAPELATVTEISSFNYRWNSYQEYLKHAPHMIVYQSEATTNELVAPFYGMDREKMVGLAYWGAIEYWGESNGWPKKGWSYSFFDHSMQAFPQAYLIKSIFTDEALVRIGVVDTETEKIDWNDQTIGTANLSSHWNREQGKKYNIYTYTNAEKVELFINGKSMGIQSNNDKIETRNMILWKNIPYETGKVEAVALKNGKAVARHQLETTGKAVGLVFEAENPDWKANGMDLQYIKVYAVDSKGRRVYTTTGEVEFHLSGQAKLIAIDNGDHFSDELFGGNKRKLHKGYALAILRSNRQSGEVEITATVKGLKQARLKMQTN